MRSHAFQPGWYVRLESAISCCVRVLRRSACVLVSVSVLARIPVPEHVSESERARVCTRLRVRLRPST